MKSYFLEGQIDDDLARCELSKLLPTQTDPWLLTSEAGDAIAYFYLATDEDNQPCIQVDVSGRHLNPDSLVLNVLHTLQRKLGGTVRDDR